MEIKLWSSSKTQLESRHSNSYMSNYLKNLSSIFNQLSCRITLGITIEHSQSTKEKIKKILFHKFKNYS